MGNILSIRARTVYENDEFEIIGGTEDSIQHKICLTNKGKEIGYYVVVDIKNARPLFHYMSVEEIATHRKTFSKGGGEFWDKFPDQMAYKTIFIKLFKWLPNNSYLREVMEIEGEDFSHSHSEVVITRQTRAEKIAGLISDGEDTKPEGDSEFQDSFESDEDADDLPIPLEESHSLQRHRERIY
jgi:recombinational DNA repair protein RecT